MSKEEFEAFGHPFHYNVERLTQSHDKLVVLSVPDFKPKHYNLPQKYSSEQYEKIFGDFMHGITSLFTHKLKELGLEDFNLIRVKVIPLILETETYSKEGKPIVITRYIMNKLAYCDKEINDEGKKVCEVYLVFLSLIYAFGQNMKDISARIEPLIRDSPVLASERLFSNIGLELKTIGENIFNFYGHFIDSISEKAQYGPSVRSHKLSIDASQSSFMRACNDIAHNNEMGVNYIEKALSVLIKADDEMGKIFDLISEKEKEALDVTMQEYSAAFTDYNKYLNKLKGLHKSLTSKEIDLQKLMGELSELKTLSE